MALPMTFGGHGIGVQLTLTMVAILLLLFFRSSGLLGGLFLISLLLVHWIGLPSDQIGIEVGHWDPSRWLGGVYAHAGLGHLLTNVNHAILPLASLTILPLRWGGFLVVTVCCLLGYVVGIQLLGTQGEIHIGASGVVCGLMAGSITSLLLVRFSVDLLPLYVGATITVASLMRFCSPTGDPSGSWEGHLGGAMGGMLGVLVFALPRLSEIRAPSYHPPTLWGGHYASWTIRYLIYRSDGPYGVIFVIAMSTTCLEWTTEPIWQIVILYIRYIYCPDALACARGPVAP